jgi:hypothetical protein
VILDKLEQAFMVIGDRVITVGGGAKALDSYDIKQENVTAELIVKPRAAGPQEPIETRQSLNNMTKQAICELCVERFGIDLNFRTEKKLLITEFLCIQQLEI